MTPSPDWYNAMQGKKYSCFNCGTRQGLHWYALDPNVAVCATAECMDAASNKYSGTHDEPMGEFEGE